jgi:hypothetical protein
MWMKKYGFSLTKTNAASSKFQSQIALPKAASAILPLDNNKINGTVCTVPFLQHFKDMS